MKSSVSLSCSLPPEALPLAALVVTFNRAEVLRRSISYTLEQPFTHVLVVDNASTDETQDLLEFWCQQDSRLQVLRLPSNGGGAMGFEQGLRFLDHQLRGRGWVLLFDDDAWPVPGCVGRFHEQRSIYQSLNLTAVAAAVFDPDGNVVEVNRPILNPFRHPLAALRCTLPSACRLRDLYHVPLSWLDPVNMSSISNIHTIHAASFVGLFLCMEALPRQGCGRYPSGKLFIYSDDTSYTLDLHRRGHRLAMDSSLQFVHATFQRPAGQIWMSPLWKHYYIVRNSFVVNASLSRLFFIPLCLLTVISHSVRAILFGLRSRSIALLRVVVVGIWDGLRSDFSRPHKEVIALGELPPSGTR